MKHTSEPTATVRPRRHLALDLAPIAAAAAAAALAVAVVVGGTTSQLVTPSTDRSAGVAGVEAPPSATGNVITSVAATPRRLVPAAASHGLSLVAPPPPGAPRTRGAAVAADFAAAGRLRAGFGPAAGPPPAARSIVPPVVGAPTVAGDPAAPEVPPADVELATPAPSNTVAPRVATTSSVTPANGKRTSRPRTSEPAARDGGDTMRTASQSPAELEADATGRRGGGKGGAKGSPKAKAEGKEPDGDRPSGTGGPKGR